ncbi:ribonuclease 3-like protein 2-like [Trifolium pratense]|uniref:Ribonuclease 3-like protein 2-like n=2 Tax=Trifolium pratense TaxID=57577 RepID=A0A2K3P6F9_TRIPR|nr:ribonuclease 3-like protein 2-like [Trifolium pratense]
MKMEASVAAAAVEKIIGYTFRNKKLLEEALTHTSIREAVSYKRLEFVGGAVLGLAISNYLFHTYTSVDPHHLSLLRDANVSTKKLACAAVYRGLHYYVRHNTSSIDDQIREFVDAVEREKDCAVVLYGGSVKAPKILADIIESIAAAVYSDVDFDLKKSWVVIRGLLEPIATLDDLQQKLQPVVMLYEICEKSGKKLDIRQWGNGAKSTASVYVDEELVALASSDRKDIAKLDAAKLALHKLEPVLPSVTVADFCTSFDGTFDIEAAKQKLHKICEMKNWTKPVYSIEKDEGNAQNKIYVAAVEIATPDGRLRMLGDEKSRLKVAQNSAASLMIRGLQQGKYL